MKLTIELHLGDENSRDEMVRVYELPDDTLTADLFEQLRRTVTYYVNASTEKRAEEAQAPKSVLLTVEDVDAIREALEGKGDLVDLMAEIVIKDCDQR
jgi:hypothetical protein